MDETNKEEMYFSASSSSEGEIPTPTSRKDQFLYALATGEKNNVPEPTNRWETYMKSAIENGGGSGGINYSTEEQDTGLKWIDGRTVYQKTFVGTSNAGQNFTLLEQDFYSTKELVEAKGSYGEFQLGFYSSGNYHAYITTNYNSGYIALSYGPSYRGKNYIVTINYIYK